MSNVVIEKIEEVLTGKYSVQNYVEFIQEVFDSVKIVAPDRMRKEYTNFSSHIVGSSHIGNYIDPNGKKLIIFSVELLNKTYVETSRSTQRSYAKKLIESAGADGALIAFYTEGDTKWRISFVRLDYEIKFENGKLKSAENMTPAKRYSYLVGEGEPCHTAIDRFRGFITEKNSNPTLDELENAFSVEAVTNEFFNLYCQKFKQLLIHLEDNPDFVIEAQLHNFTAAQFAKKLMGQIVFLYFLQKKGWLGVGAWPNSLNEKEYKNAYYARGSKSRELIPKVYIPVGDGNYRVSAKALDAMSNEDEKILAECVKGKPWGSGPHNFMRKLFEVSEKKGKNFFDDYLEPLFYNALNINRGEQGYDPDLHCRIPFLSGGLFEPIDGYDWEHNDFAIPNEVFSNRINNNPRTGDGILDIFDRYNFTMSEDEPMEREVAIDPEMLGKVFENLLEVNDRKAKGAFYTPREIVHYMCQENLIYYLKNTLKISENDIRDFILYGDFMKDADTEKTIRVTEADGSHHMEFDFKKDLFISDNILSFKRGINRLDDLDKALADVRVADPAVGSGAFPLGMLNEIVRARQNISAYKAITMNKAEARNMYSYDRSVYNLKYNTIKNCIYAADIEPSAVDIAQLRLWLSLVIDDEINPEAQNIFDGHRNPLPLPNLECNIICGNSLVDEFDGQSLIPQSKELNTERGEEYGWNQGEIDNLIPKLIDAQNRLFSCEDKFKKESIKSEIAAIKDQMIRAELSNFSDDALNRYLESKKEISKPYVLWQVDFARIFKEKNGFDIVIGNPPYLKEIDYKEIFAEVNKTDFGKKYGEGKMNFWYFFFHKGMNILNSKGHLSFIAPNYFVAGSGASKLNKRLVNECTIRQYIDFNKTKVFDTADVQCMILVVGNYVLEEDLPFKAFMFKKKVDRTQLPAIMGALDKSDVVEKYIVNKQKDILMPDLKINFENAKYARLLGKIDSKTSEVKLFKATQGIVENPSFLNKKNIASVNQKGIDTSMYNPGDYVFVVPKEHVGELNLTEFEEKYLREYHEPNEVHRYYCDRDFKNYLLYLTKENVKDINDLPNIKKHLLKYKPFMEMRRETQKGSNEWFHLHWPRKEELFCGEKVVYPQMGAVPVFAYSNTPFYTNMSANIVYALERINIKVLTTVLNSTLAHFWLLHRAKNRGIGLDIAVSVIDKFPINKTILEDPVLEELAEKAIQFAYNNEDYSNIDKLIDERVFEIYQIDQSEQETIQSYINDRINYKG